MRDTFKHLSHEQRVKIKELLDAGMKRNAIANLLGVNNSTIYREIKRGSLEGHYSPDYAEEQYRHQLAGKGRQPICSLSQELAEYIAELILNEKLSPAKIVDRLQKEERWTTIPKSGSTIYSAIDCGLIPGVNRESLLSYTTSVFNDGDIHIPKWARTVLCINDGDKLLFEIADGKLIFSKESK